MALPVNITDLVHGKSIEWARLEFKKGWNPEDVVHTMCAFANDLDNWGGGYIILGIEEDNGKPVLPPQGLSQNQLDNLQGKVMELGHKITPNYLPVIQPYVLQDNHILVLWCPAGDNRPYSAPVVLNKKETQKCPFVRVGSRSIIAKGEKFRRLQELTARIPFDDRVNTAATIDDFDLGLIQAYLQEVKSDLYAESTRMSLAELARTMRIAKGPEEDLRPVNFGLMFFSRNPERFFDRTWIELVWHENESGKQFREYYFKGPLHQQLRDVLTFLRTNILAEYVIKQPGRAEADRFYNFPYAAIEEVLANAVYHKSYELRNPIEVQVWPDKIEVLSFPGPVPPVDAEVLKSQKRIVAREYRNRRIGDILKELHLTEGRGTGFPTIYKAMAENGSPEPVLETDKDNTCFLSILPARKEITNQVTNQVNNPNLRSLEDLSNFTYSPTNQATNQAVKEAKKLLIEEIHDEVENVLRLTKDWTKRAEILEKLYLSNQTYNREKYLDPIIRYGWIKMEYPDKKTSPKQRYKITEAGKVLLELLASDSK